MVPTGQMLSGWATVTVPDTSPRTREGFEVTFCHAEIETAFKVSLGQESRYVYTREEAETLPDAEAIFIPDGIVFRKWSGTNAPVNRSGAGSGTNSSAPTSSTRKRTSRPGSSEPGTRRSPLFRLIGHHVCKRWSRGSNRDAGAGLPLRVRP